MSFGCYGTCAVSRDLAQLAHDEHEMSDESRNSLCVDVSEALADPKCWQYVQELIDETSTLNSRVSDALRRASKGDRAAFAELEAVAFEARELAADRIVDRYIATNPKPPYAPARLLAKYPTGNIPLPELLYALQMDRAA